ncbi:hypothetical protein M409DRAFT_24456 [Zasmidium cellare ATCC 36951]|uniref:DUF7730 domain-containing protein n=1 Tax=Zasmidium cellare ATCC 36951 TaxID=1080233 RepID=A0A6A6CFQ3_ZASCE|nr:uncharacterized protein M409DRAFT_24456 [Zasmidium cellare ATCC 36951]KAF2165070.1 hypothetical protein M409DRAFT_24456 [Zasmidium cellare ATCC 36951]
MPPPAKRRKASASKAAAPTTSTDLTTPTEPTTSSSATNAYPGFDPWHATLDIDAGDNKMSVFNTTKSQFMHSAKIYDSDAFKLKPLTVADGPLKGRHVIMLEPINDFFRFMDFPPEIRNIVYDMLFQEAEDIEIVTFKSKFSGQRAVRRGFKRQSKHPGDTWNPQKSNWEHQTPSVHSLLKTCQQIKEEAAPVAYGSNRFSFNGLPELKAFLSGIGTMRQFLRQIRLVYGSYHHTVAATTFHKLKDAKDLQSVTFPHDMVCGDCRPERLGRKSITIRDVLVHTKPFLKAFHKAQKSKDDPVNVPDIICVAPETWPRFCEDGEMGRSCTCTYLGDPSSCRERLQHTKEVQVDFRKAVADELGIEVTSSKEE